MNAAIMSMPSTVSTTPPQKIMLTASRTARSPHLPLPQVIHHPPSILPLHTRIPLLRQPQSHPIRRALLPLQHPRIRHPQTPRTGRQQHYPILSLPILEEIAEQLCSPLRTVRENWPAHEQDVDVPGTGVVGVRGSDVDVGGAAGGGEGGGEIEKFHVDALGHYVGRDREGLICEIEVVGGAVAEEAGLSVCVD
jgi:hypothetical protein